MLVVISMNSNELQKIIRAAELVNSNIHVNEVLKNIVTVAAELTCADRGTLYLVDKNKNELWSLIAMGNEVQEIRLKMGEGLAGYVASSGETINIKDVRKDPRFNSEIDLQSGYTTKNMICFPIKNNKGEIIGVLQLLNSKNGKFSERDEKFLVALSIQSALAINHALMHLEQISVNEKLQKAYKELELAKQETEKYVMLKTHFLSQMSHEIRTPLNMILGGIQLLKMKTDLQQSDDMIELFGILEIGSQRIIRTIDEILEMSRIRSGNYELNLEPVKIEEDIIQQIIKNLEVIAAKKNIDLIFEKATDKNNIVCDKFMTYQMFLEILDNAIKFTKKGNVFIKQFVDNKNHLCVSIKDTGIGISSDYLEHIFEPFSQEYTGYSRKFEGNGLALALVKKYAELNKFTITVNSKKNVGTEFSIIFNES